MLPLRHQAMAAMMLVAVITIPAQGDTPASSVHTQAVAPGQSYPGVDAHSEGWFDVGGFCKVVDVGDLSAIAPTARGIPVFIPGPASQWENYRTAAPGHYDGQLTLTTCCRPQANVATLCASATNPQAVSRDYGRVGETDTVSASCVATGVAPYTETVSLTCQGDNSPDGQAAWAETGDTGAPAVCPAFTVAWGNRGWNANTPGDHSGETPDGDQTICSAAVPAGTLGQVIALPTATTGTATAPIRGTSPNLICTEGFHGAEEYIMSALNGRVPVPGQWVTAYETGSGSLADMIDNNGDPYINTEVAGGSCVTEMCIAGTISWSVGGNTCSATIPNTQSTVRGIGLDHGLGGGVFSPPDEFTFYGPVGNTLTVTEQSSATSVGGEANLACGSDGTWQVQPGAVCGINACNTPTTAGCGACIPSFPGSGSGFAACNDACGNSTGSEFCTIPGVPSQPPPDQPQYCAPGTVFSSCQLQAYRCNDTGITYDDCANECLSGGPLNTTPSGIQTSTWGKPTCGNGTQCQFGFTLCLEDTPASLGVLVDIVCNNADGSATCPAPTFPK